MAGKKTIEALTLHKKGFNCAQAVLLPFSEELGLDRKTAMAIAEGFGAGMGGCKLTCGALSAAIMIAGMKNSSRDLMLPNSKTSTYALCREINEAFEKEIGSCICGEIKGIATGKPLKTCDECIIAGAKLAEKIIGK
ncbi:MAG: C_GCAxxG_C_C family protein [Clostridia bacterium]|nr:C_GCAxxG_C_C family protein [Clostridia bacterium]